MKEKWCQIAGFDDYMVSNRGRILSLKQGFPKLMKIISGMKNARSNGRVALYRNGKPFYLTVGRLVLLAFVGPPPPDKTSCLHKDDDRLNNRLDNLRWGDQLDNVIDAERNGRGRAKIHPSLIPKIFQLRQIGLTHSQIAKKFGVCTVHISHIINGHRQHRYKEKLARYQS